MQQNWQTVTLGADVPDVPARMACTQGGDNILSVHLKFRARNGRVYMVSACIDLKVIEAELAAGTQATLATPEAAALLNGQTLDVETSGRLGRRIRRKLKKVAKKIAHSKLVKTVVKTARKALNNPLVQAALSAVPGGAAAIAVRNAARIAARAVKGAKKARRTIKSVMAGLESGDHEALESARLLKAGIRTHGVVPRKFLIVAGGAAANERTFLYAVLGECVSGNYDVIAGADGVLASDRAQVDDDPTDQEAFEEFATSGAWEGVRWLAKRLGVHSMTADPDAFGRRDALLLGQAAQAQFASR